MKFCKGIAENIDVRFILPYLIRLEGAKNPRAGHSTAGTNQASCPIDGLSLELQSHGKVSVREPLTVHDAGECSEITHK